MDNAYTGTPPRVLLCWAGRPGYVPPPTLSTNQVTIYSHHDRSTPGIVSPQTRVSELQEYDLREAVKTLGYSTDFDLICVSTGGASNNHPRNLDAFHCPKVLLSGDTHHASLTPIQDVFEYYLDKEDYNLALSLHNRDHTKWIGHGRNLRLGWIPGLTAQNFPATQPLTHNQSIAFVGSWKRNHLRRKSFIQKFHRDGLPFDHQKLSRQKSSQHYAESLISFNCSLNGDLNLRVFEILSSGGLLLTDRLAKESGLNATFEEGHDYVAYSHYQECREKIQYYLSHPEQALTIRERGLKSYRERYLPEMLANDFLDWALENKRPNLNYSDVLVQGDNVEFKTRLEIYEYLLISQLWRETTNVLYIGGRAKSIVSDISGLARVKASIENDFKPGKWQALVIDSTDKYRFDKLNLTEEKIFFI